MGNVTKHAIQSSFKRAHSYDENHEQNLGDPCYDPCFDAWALSSNTSLELFQ